jgi:ABC-type phosphate transport system ATPase subunit
VLLLDEPTSALDPSATAAVEGIVAERRAHGTAVVWTTHDREQAKRVASRLLVLDQGRVEERPF